LGKTNKGQATLVRLAPLNLFQGDAKFLAWLAGESSSVDLFPAVFLTGPPDRIVGLKVRRFAYRALPNADFGPLEVASERAILVIRMIGRRFKRTSKLSVFLEFLCCQTGAAMSEAKSSGTFVEPREFAANVVFFRENDGRCENLTRNGLPGDGCGRRWAPSTVETSQRQMSPDSPDGVAPVWNATREFRR
jgi:hypothetical protein